MRRPKRYVACHMASRLAETSGRRRLTFHGAGQAGLAEFFLGGGGWPMKIFGGGGEFGDLGVYLYMCHMPVGLDRGWHRGSRMCKQA